MSRIIQTGLFPSITGQVADGALTVALHPRAVNGGVVQTYPFGGRCHKAKRNDGDTGRYGEAPFEIGYLADISRRSRVRSRNEDQTDPENRS